MKISQNCLDIIKKWEGFKLDAYIDPVGIPTIGYGTIRYPNGQKVKIGDRISEAEAEAFLKFEVDEMIESLEIFLEGVKLTQNQFDAVVSLCYNIGVGGFSGSTVLKKIKTGDFKAAAEAFLLWNKGTVNGVKKVLTGLTNRRKDEKLLFEKQGDDGKPIEVEKSKQDSVTRLEGYREGKNNVIVAFNGKKVVEILVLKSSFKEDLIEVLQIYKNASSFEFAEAGKTVPAGERVEIVGKKVEIPVVDAPPVLQRKLLLQGMSDKDNGAVGGNIAQLQGRLKDLGYYKDEIDGIFGKVSDEAVREFQADIFGLAEADGKVGPKTWEKLWGTPGKKTEKPKGTPSPGKNYLLLTKTNTKDTAGCFKLKLDYVKDGLVQDSMFVVSGTPKRQFFRKGKDSVRGSFEPLPEGKWFIHDILWANGPDVYDKKVHANVGIGPVKIPVDFVPKNGTNRDLIQIHIDWNRSTSPGTAGCIGVASVSDFKRLVSWLRDTDPRDLYVDYGLGSVQLP